MPKLAVAGLIAAVALAPRLAAAETVVRWMINDSTPAQTQWMKDVAHAYEQGHPGVRIDVQPIAGEAYKAKLTTALQSNDRPNLIYTWSGGVFFAQAEAGVLQDITARMTADWAGRYSPAAVAAMTYKGKVYGAPMNVSQVGLFYNKAVIAKAGVKPEDLSDWDGFLNAVKTIKAAGIVPISAGGADKWPLNMFWECLAVRIGGKAAFDSAYSRQGPGFDGPDYLKTAQEFKRLIDLDPFQKGFLGFSEPQASGYFGDGNAAFHLMGNWAYNTQRTESVSKKGLGDDLAYTTFPLVKGGKGDPEDTISGINGYLVTKGAPPEAVDFLNYFTNLENQSEAAKRGFFIPVAKGAEAGMANPVFKQIALNLSKAKYIQNFYDQMLGPSVGRVVNDTSADLAAGKITPAQVGQAIQDAWSMEQ